MERDSSQFNNVRESEFFEFIDDSEYDYPDLQQPINSAYGISATNDNSLLSNINENDSMADEYVDSTASSHEAQRNIRVNNEPDNSQQQQYVAASTASTYPAVPAPQYNSHQDASQFVSNVVPQLTLRVDYPTMIIYESLEYHIILIPKRPLDRQEYPSQ